MRVFRLVHLLSIITLLGGQALYPSGHAYAWKPCCDTCDACLSQINPCWCPGLAGCPYYYCPPGHHPDDSQTMQAQALTNNERLAIAGAYSSRPSTALRSYSIDRLIARVSSGQCDKDDVAQKFFRDAESWLKFEPDFLKYNAGEDNDLVASHSS